MWSQHIEQWQRGGKKAMPFETGLLYQDMWVKGRVVIASGIYNERGIRTTEGPICADRYDMIQRVIKNEILTLVHPHKLTVVDVGANLGYFGIRLVEDFNTYDVQVVAVENRDTPLLLSLIAMNSMLRHIAVKQDIFEQFDKGFKADVVLMLNVLHHLDRWKYVFEHHRSICSGLMFIQHPTNGDTGSENMERVKEINEYFSMVVKTDTSYKVRGAFSSHRTDTVMRPLFTVRGYC